MRKRGFEEVQEVIRQMTSGKPERCPNNISVTKRSIQALGLEPALNRLQYVHIAGTKGKGTTCGYTSGLLEAYGYRVGLFASPHLVDVRERMLINNALIPKQTFSDYFFEVYDRQRSLLASESQCDQEIASRSNFFRFMFCLSLYAFEMEKVDVAVMEVGIGGRLDATNVISPKVCGITALGMDHMEILGDTIESIAAEKGGILKREVPCFSDPQRSYPQTRKVLTECAKKADTSIIFLDPGVLPIRSWPPLAMGGSHMLDNAKLALCISRYFRGVPISFPLNEVESGCLKRVKYAGRSQIVQRSDKFTYFLDGAHTPESMFAACNWFFNDATKPGQQNVVVFYTTREHRGLFKALIPHTKRFFTIIFANIENPKKLSSGESHDGREIVMAATETWRLTFPEVRCAPCPAPFASIEDVESLITTEFREEEVPFSHVNVLVTGSLFLVGDFLKLLGEVPVE